MKKKITAAALVLALLAITVIGGTMAYFTDTKDVTNTFTMGNVKITLEEDKWDADADHALIPGKVYEKNPTVANVGSEDAYLFLDVNLNKFNSLLWVMAADASADNNIDFTIFDDNGAVLAAFKNDAGQFSTTAFVNYLIGNKTVAQAIVNKWFAGIEHTDWEVKNIKSFDGGETLTVRLAYTGNFASSASVKFMDSFGMPASVTQTMMENGKTIGGQQHAFNETDSEFNLTFKAYAIQKAELTADGAYGALFAE